MAERDAEPARPGDEPTGRYATVTDCTGRTLLYDLENADAWVRSDDAVDLGERR